MEVYVEGQKLIDRLTLGASSTIAISVFTSRQIDYSTVGTDWQKQFDKFDADYQYLHNKACGLGEEVMKDVEAAGIYYLKKLAKDVNAPHLRWSSDKLIDRNQLPSNSHDLDVDDFITGIDYRPLGTQLEQLVQLELDYQQVDRKAHKASPEQVHQVNAVHQYYYECIRSNYDNLHVLIIVVVHED